MVTKTDYNQIAVTAAYSVLIEITRILGQYRDNIVLIGGWVPQFLFQNKNELHSGSIDVDLALDHKRITSFKKSPHPGRIVKIGKKFFQRGTHRAKICVCI